MQQIEFRNNCGCIVDYNLLEKAILFHSPNIKKREFSIFVNTPPPKIYPRINLKGYKYVHRLIGQYLHQDILFTPLIVVHHKDANPLNICIDNLVIMSNKNHSRLHIQKDIGMKLGELVCLYESGLSAYKLAIQCNVSIWIIYRRLHEAGAAMKPRGQYRAT